MPSAAGIRAVIPRLTHLFDVHGRGGYWSLVNPDNNPCRSAFVDDYKRGLERYINRLAPPPVAAHPLSDAKFFALLSSLDARLVAMRASCVTPFQRVRCQAVARDGLMFLYLKESFQRGGEGAAIRLVDVTIPGDPRALTPADPRLLAAPVVRVTPPTLKGHRGPPGLGIDIARGLTPATCFLRRLHAYALICAELGLPLVAPSYHLFRPMNPRRRTALLNESLTTSAVQSRLRDALDRAGLNEGETTHSFRRANFQAARARGEPQAETMAKALITTDAVYNLYCNTGRPTRYRPAPAAVGPLALPPPPSASSGRALSRQLSTWLMGRAKAAGVLLGAAESPAVNVSPDPSVENGDGTGANPGAAESEGVAVRCLPSVARVPTAANAREGTVLSPSADPALELPQSDDVAVAASAPTQPPSRPQDRDTATDNDEGAEVEYASAYERSMAQIRARKRQRLAAPPTVVAPVCETHADTPAPAFCVVQ